MRKRAVKEERRYEFGIIYFLTVETNRLIYEGNSRL